MQNATMRLVSQKMIILSHIYACFFVNDFFYLSLLLLNEITSALFSRNIHRSNWQHWTKCSSLNSCTLYITVEISLIWMNCNIDFLTLLYEYFSLVRAPYLSKYSTDQLLWNKTDRFDLIIIFYPVWGGWKCFELSNNFNER